MVVGVLGDVSTTHAESVRITPLEYRTELKSGERKKGFVDITNPSNESVNLKLYVNGFSQVDNKGNLTFFNNEQLSKGLLLDYDSTTLEAQQTLRLYFIADGTKLPPGDVFGVIFAETDPGDKPGATTSVRVGTLVMITNGTPGPRQAEISQLDVPFWQLGSDLSGEVTVRNTAAKGAATGFFPEISVESMPWGAKSTFTGPLIFAGNARTSDFAVPSNQFGLYTIKVKANNSEATKVVFLMTGWWRVIAPVVCVLVAGAAVVTIKFRLWRKLRFKRR